MMDSKRRDCPWDRAQHELRLSPQAWDDGKWLAFSGRDEGHLEVYVMPADGGQPTRLTYLGANSIVTGFTPVRDITFASDARQPFMKRFQAFCIDLGGGVPTELPTGPANLISYQPNGNGVVIARPQVEAAFWKRYRGGTAGDIWIDARGDGDFKRLIKLDGNPSRPIWIGDQIYFLSDHEGVGNIYSCDGDGNDLRRHTHHQDFYARTIGSGDRRRIVYHAGGELFLFDPSMDVSKNVSIDFRSPRTQRNRKFIEADKYLENYEPHPQGHLLALTVRGKFVTLGNFGGPVQQHGEPAPGRFRLAQWLNDGKRLVVVSDAEGIETLEIHRADEIAEPERLAGLDVGRVVSLAVSPGPDQIALTNHRNELVLVDLIEKNARVLDRSEHFPMLGFDFSPDGRWLAYGCAESLHTSVIKLCNLEDGKVVRATRAVLMDLSPTFDPDGKYLYFLSRREFDPVYDGLHFDLGFPKGMRPYLITLRKDLPNPFALPPKPSEEPKIYATSQPQEEASCSKPSFSIDLDGIENRTIAFPVPEGIYQQIKGIPGKALFTSVPVEGALKMTWIPDGEPPAKAKLESWEFAAGKCETRCWCGYLQGAGFARAPACDDTKVGKSSDADYQNSCRRLSTT
jgi:tricorn protease